MRTSISGSTRAFKRRVLREALWYWADELDLGSVQLSLIFTPKLPRTTGAEMWSRGGRKFTIRCSSQNGPYRTLEDLSHEMIHIKQFVTGTLKERNNGTAWKGKVYRGDYEKLDETYWNAPWEVDAHGRSYWLYKKCRLHLLRCGFKLSKRGRK